jgi:hypothetical protein
MQRTARVQTSSQAACDARKSTGRRLQRPLQAFFKHQSVQVVEVIGLMGSACVHRMLCGASSCYCCYYHYCHNRNLRTSGPLQKCIGISNVHVFNGRPDCTVVGRKYVIYSMVGLLYVLVIGGVLGTLHS